MYALSPAMTRSKANCQGYYKTLLKHMGLYCIGMHGLSKFCFYNVTVVALN